MLKLKTYAEKEERLNIISHAAGAALTPLALLLMIPGCREDVRSLFACIVYAAAMLLMFLGSSCYHAAKDPKRRLQLRRCDHAAIYLLIAGTYTPLMLIGCRGHAGYTVLALVWLIAAVGIVMELTAFKPFKGCSLVLYLLSGWLCVSILGELIRALSLLGFSLLLGGGIAYSLGVIFYVRRRLYSHALWHFFVIGGVLLQYGAVLTLLFSCRH